VRDNIQSEQSVSADTAQRRGCRVRFGCQLPAQVVGQESWLQAFCCCTEAEQGTRGCVGNQDEARPQAQGLGSLEAQQDLCCSISLRVTEAEEAPWFDGPQPRAFALPRHHPGQRCGVIHCEHIHQDCNFCRSASVPEAHRKQGGRRRSGAWGTLCFFKCKGHRNHAPSQLVEGVWAPANCHKRLNATWWNRRRGRWVVAVCAGGRVHAFRRKTRRAKWNPRWWQHAC